MLTAVRGHFKSGSWRTVCTLSPRMGILPNMVQYITNLQNIFQAEQCGRLEALMPAGYTE